MKECCLTESNKSQILHFTYVIYVIFTKNSATHKNIKKIIEINGAYGSTTKVEKFRTRIFNYLEWVISYKKQELSCLQQAIQRWQRQQQKNKLKISSLCCCGESKQGVITIINYDNSWIPLEILRLQKNKIFNKPFTESTKVVISGPYFNLWRIFYFA